MEDLDDVDGKKTSVQKTESKASVEELDESIDTNGDEIGQIAVDDRVQQAIENPTNLESATNASLIIQATSPIPQHGRKYANEDTTHDNWWKHQKHVFVLSIAGKPIYSRYGDEQNLAPFMASLTAMVSYIQDMDDNLRYVVAGIHKFVFLVKGPIILVTICSTYEPVSQISQQLNYLYSQVISILTSNVNQIFQRRAHFDLRNLLGGADRFLDNLSSLMDHDFSFVLNSIHCLRLPTSTRDSIASIIQSSKVPDVLYAVLISKYQLVSLLRPKKYILQPSDLHLIINFVNSSAVFKASDTWTPLCLPKFNDQGFLHAYVAFIEKEVCLLLISTKADSFYEMGNSKNMIVQGLTKGGYLEKINKSVNNKLYPVSELGIPTLLHFLYKSKSLTQYTCPRFEAPYHRLSDQKRIYQRIHKRVHKFKKPHKVLYQVTHKETVIGWVTTGFELFATFSALESKANAIKACNDILKWVKNEEDSLFILNSPVWQ